MLKLHVFKPLKCCQARIASSTNKFNCIICNVQQSVTLCNEQTLLANFRIINFLYFQKDKSSKSRSQSVASNVTLKDFCIQTSNDDTPTFKIKTSKIMGRLVYKNVSNAHAYV